MSRYFKPKIAQAADVAVNVGSVAVSANAAKDLATRASYKRSGTAKFTTTVSVREARKNLGTEGIRAAAKAAGRTPPSERTIRRWIQQDRVPDSKTAQILQRASFVQRSGGVKELAKQLGRSENSVRRWKNGKQELSGSAKTKLAKTKVTDVLKRRRAIDKHGVLKTPKITIKGDVDVRVAGSSYNNILTGRVMRFSSDTATSLPGHETLALVQALMEGDHAKALVILETHASLNYAAFDAFGGGDGFHFTNIADFQVSWDDLDWEMP